MNYMYETIVIREPIGIEQRVQTNDLELALLKFVNWIDEFGDEPGLEVQFNCITDDDGEFIMSYRDGIVHKGEE